MRLNLNHSKMVNSCSPASKVFPVNKETELKLPPKPAEPDPSECCNRGCENCVFIYYEKALLRWQEKVEKIKKKAAQKN
jgi:oxidoreductase family protein